MLFAPERWADLSTADERFGRNEWGEQVGDGRPYGACEQILRCWRTLQRMQTTGSGALSAVVLYALYGGLPPGMPRPGLWRPGLDAEYRRVCRYAPSASVGGVVEFEKLVEVDKKRRPGETQVAFETRVAGQRASSYAVLAEVARECERLIVSAAGDYRAAWRVS